MRSEALKEALIPVKAHALNIANLRGLAGR
jgi:hypothetical protein